MSNGRTDSESRSPAGPTGCERALTAIPLWVGGELESSEADFVRAHVELCSACHGRAAAAERARTAFREVGLAHARAAEADAPALWPALRRELAEAELIPRLDERGAPARPAAAHRREPDHAGREPISPRREPVSPGSARRPAWWRSMAARSAALAAAAGFLAYLALPSGDALAPERRGASPSDAGAEPLGPVAASIPASVPLELSSGHGTPVQPVSFGDALAARVPPEFSALGYSAYGLREVVDECQAESDPFGASDVGMRRLRVGEPSLAELALQGALLDHATGQVYLARRPLWAPRSASLRKAP